jgi:hypothetical protein
MTCSSVTGSCAVAPETNSKFAANVRSNQFWILVSRCFGFWIADTRIPRIEVRNFDVGCVRWWMKDTSTPFLVGSKAPHETVGGVG